MRSYVDKANNILCDENISQALVKSNIRNTKVSKAYFDNTKDALDESCVKHITLYHSFEFSKKGEKCDIITV